MVFRWKEGTQDIHLLAQAVEGLRRDYADVSKLSKGHVCDQAVRIEVVTESLESSSKTIAAASEKLAVVDSRLTGLERVRDRVYAAGLTVAMFLVGMATASAVAFFTLSGDVRVVSRDVDALASECERVRSITAESVADAVLTQMERTGMVIDRRVGLRPGAGSDVLRDVRPRATTTDKRMLLDAVDGVGEGGVHE